jgi:lysophospholipid acyltransferase
MALSSFLGVFDTVSSSIGIPADQLILVFCFFAALPLGLVQHYFIRGELPRHLYSIVCGMSFALLQFGLYGLVHFFITSAGVYAMLLTLPRNKVAFPVLCFCLSYLSYMHLYRMITDWMGWKMDATGLQMLMTCKLSLLAYAYQDAEVIKTDPDRVPNEQKKILIQKLPSLLEYYSYICFYPSISIGPSFEYSDYIRFVHEKDEFKKIPSTILPSIRVLGISLIFLALTFIGEKYFPHMYCSSEDFSRQSFWYKVYFFNCAMVVAKIKYTSAWKLTESSMIASGLGHTVDAKGEHSWDRAISINWKKAEYAWTAKEMVENWNRSVSVWLRRCIFNRILVSSKDPKQPSSLRRNLAQHISYLFSAFWHGFYPAYYMMFFLFSIHSEISKMVYVSDWSRLPAKNFFKVIAWIMMWQIGNFLGIVFLSLDIRLAWRFLSSLHYFPVIQLFIAWSFFKITGFHIKTKKQQ